MARIIRLQLDRPMPEARQRHRLENEPAIGGSPYPVPRLCAICRNRPYDPIRSDPGTDDAARLPGQRALRRGQHLFWAGDPVTQIWTVQRGSLKTYRISGDGDERVNGFFFAGGVIGWEDLACGFSQHHCIALEPVTVVNDAIASILDGALGSPQNQARLLDGIRTEFLRLESILWLEHRTAEERLTRFLLWLAASQPNGNGDARTVSLPMSRHDIGSYLGLATETVSRRLTLFHRNGWITLSRRQLRINDVHRLQQIGEF